MILCFEFKVLRQFGIGINRYANYRELIDAYPELAYGQKDLNLERTYTTYKVLFLRVRFRRMP